MPIVMVMVTTLTISKASRDTRPVFEAKKKPPMIAAAIKAKINVPVNTGADMEIYPIYR
jgi:hypothetical protein